MERPRSKPWQSHIGPMLLIALLYYLNNLWKSTVGDDKKKQSQFNSRTLERLRNCKCQMLHKVEVRDRAKNRIKEEDSLLHLN